MATIRKDIPSGRSRSVFQPPTSWRRKDVFVASLGINLLALALPMVILQVYDRIIPARAFGTFTMLLIGMAVVIIMDVALRIFRSMILSWEGARFDHQESLNAMQHILRTETLAFESKPSGFYLDRMQALDKIQEFYSGQSILFLMDLPFAIIFLALIWIITGPLVFIPLVLLMLFGIVSVLSGRQLQKQLESRAQVEDRRQNFIIEILQGIHTVKSMAMEAFMLRRYEKLQEQSATNVYDLSRINSMVQGIGATFSQMAVIIFVGIGAASVINGELSMGALAAGTMLSGRVLQPGLRAMGFWTNFQAVRLAHGKVKEFLTQPHEASGLTQSETGIEGNIILETVQFSFPGQEQPLFSNLSLSISPGEMVGITGNNGVGKSTLINLLSGFIRPDQGRVLLDDREIGDYDLQFLRAQIGIVPQSGILFEGTILENMTLYREGTAINDAIELAHQLGLYDLVSKMPEGLDTKIGSSAVDTLSEGVRQKIVMVRSLVGNPRVILFDDANANFDLNYDARLLSLISRLKGDRTMVIVSHRPSFLRLCDRQFVLANGKLDQVSSRHSESNSRIPQPMSA